MGDPSVLGSLYHGSTEEVMKASALPETEPSFIFIPVVRGLQTLKRPHFQEKRDPSSTVTMHFSSGKDAIIESPTQIFKDLYPFSPPFDNYHSWFFFADACPAITTNQWVP